MSPLPEKRKKQMQTNAHLVDLEKFKNAAKWVFGRKDRRRHSRERALQSFSDQRSDGAPTRSSRPDVGGEVRRVAVPEDFLRDNNAARTADGKRRRDEELTGWTWSSFSDYFQSIFPRRGASVSQTSRRIRILDFMELVLGCIDVSESEKLRSVQHFSRSTRLTSFCTAQNWKFQQTFDVVQFVQCPLLCSWLANWLSYSRD